MIVRMHNPVAHALSSLTLGEPVAFENIIMFPLVEDDRSASDAGST